MLVQVAVVAVHRTRAQHASLSAFSPSPVSGTSSCQSWKGLHQPTLSGSRPPVRTVSSGPEQRRRSLPFYKPSNEIGGLVKQASCLIVTKAQITGEGGLSLPNECVCVCVCVCEGDV